MKRANNVLKLPGIDHVAKKLGTSHDVKGSAIGSSLKRIVVERAMKTSVRKMLKTLV